MSQNSENTSFLMSRLQDIDFFWIESRENLDIDSDWKYINLSRDLDFFQDDIQKKSTPVGGSENDGNFLIEWDTSVQLKV